MSRFCSLFSQILKFIPRDDFQRQVRKLNAERHARGVSCWQQLVAMLFCQLGRAHSLREIEQGLKSCEGKLAHLGIEHARQRARCTGGAQEDGRIRRWVVVPEMENRYLRVILLEDGETVHNAFFDRRFMP